MTLMFRTFAAAAVLTALAGAAAADPAPTFAHGKYVMRDGEAIFRNVCQTCHMPDARGAVGAGRYPSLAKNPKVASSAYVARVVIHGQKGMPAFGDYLDDDQVAAVAN